MSIANGKSSAAERKTEIHSESTDNDASRNAKGLRIELLQQRQILRR